MFCLYQITNLLNGKFYIGVHCDAANTPYMGSGTGIRRAIKKYGRENFRKDILAEVESEAFAYQLEGAVVDAEFVARKDTYNLCVGGNIHSATWRQVVRTANLGNQHALGYRHTEQARKKISKAGMGRTPSAVTCQKISEAKKITGNGPWSVTRRFNYDAVDTHTTRRKGRPWSDTERAKHIATSRKGKPWSPAERLAHVKQVA